MPKPLRSAAVTGVSVVAAGLALALDWRGDLAAALLIAAMALVGIASQLRTRAALPQEPKTWVRWIGHTEWLWMAAITAAAAVALYGAVKVGDELDVTIAGTAALGAVVGVALVKVLDGVVSESDWIDDKTHALAKSTFQGAYRPQFQPDGPLPTSHPDNSSQESDERLAVEHESIYGGWDAGGRAERADVMRRFIKGHPNITWSRTM